MADGQGQSDDSVDVDVYNVSKEIEYI